MIMIHRARQRGFSLLELMTVLVIVLLITKGVMMGVSGIFTSSNFGNNLEEFRGLLERARAQAMASNSYVFVGIQEVDANSASGPGGTPVPGNGCVAVAICSFNQNGNSTAYDPANPPALGPNNLLVLQPLKRLENLHITKELVVPGKPQVVSTQLFNAPSQISFSWPLNAPRYTFGGSGSQTQIIQFNPQGAAQLVPSPATPVVFTYIEINLQPTHGTVLPGENNRNVASILIDGATGAINIFRS